MMLKERIFSGWNARRAFYLVAGAGMIVISAMDLQWAGIMVGSYFVSMGLFSFGCASGNCVGGSCEQVPEGQGLQSNDVSK